MKAGIPSYAVAAYVSATRLEERKHHLTDVVGGAAIGVLAGRTVSRRMHGRRKVAVQLAGRSVPAGVRRPRVRNRCHKPYRTRLQPDQFPPRLSPMKGDPGRLCPRRKRRVDNPDVCYDVRSGGGGQTGGAWICPAAPELSPRGRIAPV